MAKNIVYFLGAGASYNFGYPLTNAIMPEILQNLREENLFEIERGDKTALEKQQEKELAGFINSLYPGLKDIAIDHTNFSNNQHIPNITEVLSFVDHCCFYNLPPHPAISDNVLLHFRYLLNRAVCEVLIDHEAEDYAVNDAQEILLNRFVAPMKADTDGQMTIITTNYDLSIDTVFKKEINKNEVDLGIAYRNPVNSKIIPQPHSPKLQYYKLHGSLNWTRCDLCGYYYINPEGNIAFQVYREDVDDGNTCTCSDSLKLKSVLVAPSIVRDIRDSNLLQIWKGAMEAIRTADELVFVGYSLPAEDLAIKSIIVRGLNGRCNKKAPAITVVQWKDSAKPNYINLFGKDINYLNEGLEQYLNNL
jgi:NAD-dependent SIR2 family protein deacetylase